MLGPFAFGGLRLRTAQLLLAALVLTVGVSCSDSPITSSPEIGGPVFAIVDGANNGGNPDVFFTEPLTDFDPTNGEFQGDLNPNLMPTARICQLEVGDGEGITPPAEGTVYDCPETGVIANLPMVYDMIGGFYRVNLKDAGSLDADYHHSIQIFLAGLDLNARRDLDVDDGPASASCTTEDYCRVNRDGQGRVGVPIKVFIENNAACLALDPTFDPNEDICATATLNAGDALLAQRGNQTIAAATPDAGATISIQSCTDLRDRNSEAEGRIDLVTWGECVEIDALDLTEVTGIAELCDAPGLALASGLSEEQVDRLTIHRFSTDVGFEGVFALGHAEGTQCAAQAQQQGQAYPFTKAQLFARAVKSTWRTVSTQVSEFLQPEALNACNRGCSSSDGFRSSYQVAGPAWWRYDASNPLGDLGTHDQGTVVAARANVFDSGELHDGSYSHPGHPYEDLRVTVTLNGVVQSPPISSDANGIVEFSFAVAGGTNTVKFEAIGVGSGDGDGNPVNNVQAPSMASASAPAVGPLTKGTLTFTAIGRVPLEFSVQPLDIYMDETTGTATLTAVTICTVGEPVDGIPVNEIVAVTNNGSWVDLTGEGFPQYTELTVEGQACVSFESLEINKTGSYRLVVNPVYNDRGKVVDGDAFSEKFNTRPPEKKE